MEEQILLCEFEKRIEDGKHIVKQLSNLKIDGVSKLQNKVKQELNFLQKSIKTGNIKKEHLICSNLTHLRAVTEKLLKHQNECISVMSNKTLTYEDGSSRKICIDLVLAGGSVWMKIIARNPKALTIVSSGDGCYGQRSIIDQAEEFILCADQHQHYFKAPTVWFYFANGVEDVLADELEEIGIKVESPNRSQRSRSLPSSIVESLDGLEDCEEVTDMIKCPVKDLEIIRNLQVISEMKEMKLNLGVTTLIAFVSSLTNGGCHCNFETDILKQHAAWERVRPVKPILDQLFQGRELYCCQTAADDFQNILLTLGGPGEQLRGEELMKKVQVIPDQPTDRLTSGGKIKDRSLAIFGTGEYLHAITVTANHGFVRSARNQGVDFAVFLHESRALTEGKELPPSLY